MTCTSFYSFLLFVLFLLVPTVVCQIIVPRPAVRPIRGATWRRPASSLQPSAIASLPSASSSALFRQLSTLSPTVRPLLSNHSHHPYCNICEGRLQSSFYGWFSFSDAIVSIPGQQNYTCDQLEFASREGAVDPAFCPLFPLFNVSGICGCSPPSPTMSPSTTSNPSIAVPPYLLSSDTCGCPVGCAGGLSATKVNQTISFGDENIIPTVACAELTSLEPDSFCNPFICIPAQRYYERICCLPGPPTTSPSLTVQPSEQPTLQPSTRYKYPICYICGNSTSRVTKLNVQLTFPGLGPINCSDLEYNGVRGLIPQPYCQSFPFFGLNTTCGCQQGSPLTLAPATVLPLSAPSQKPTVTSLRPSSRSPSHLPTPSKLPTLPSYHPTSLPGPSQLPTPTSVPPTSLPGPNQLPTQTSVPPTALQLPTQASVPPSSTPPSILPARLSSSFGVAVIPSRSLFLRCHLYCFLLILVVNFLI